MTSTPTEGCEELLRMVTQCFLEKWYVKYTGKCKEQKQRYIELCYVEGQPKAVTDMKENLEDGFKQP